MPTENKNSTLWTKNFIMITIINFLVYSSWQMFPSALPPYVQSLGGSTSVLGMINGIATIATLVIRPFSGIIMDKFGYKGIFIFGLCLMAVATAGYAIWPFVGVILVIRFIHGLAWGIASTASNTIASQSIPSGMMARGMNSFGLSISISSAISPALALSLNPVPMVWTGVAFVVVALAISFFIAYPEQPPAPTTATAPYEKSAVLPAVLIFFLTLTYGAVVTFIAIYANLAGIGFFFIFYAVGMLLVRPFLGRIIEKKGFTIPLIAGASITALALLLLSLSLNFVLIMASGLLYGVGYVMLQTILQTMSVVNVPRNRLGAANATFFTGFDGGIGLGAVVAGLIATYTGHGAMYAIMSLCMVLLVVIYLLFKRPVVES